MSGAVKELVESVGFNTGACLHTPGSQRATSETPVIGAGVDICKIAGLLGHRHITTTQSYDKRRRTISESTTHDVPI